MLVFERPTPNLIIGATMRQEVKQLIQLAAVVCAFVSGGCNQQMEAEVQNRRSSNGLGIDSGPAQKSDDSSQLTSEAAESSYRDDTPKEESPEVDGQKSSAAETGIDFISLVRPADSVEIREEATKLAEYLVQSLANNPNAYEAKARVHLMLGETAAARDAWEEALRIAPEYAYATYGLGKVALLSEDYPSAVAYLEKAAEALPAYADAHHDLADAYTKQGDIEQTKNVLKRFLERQPESAETLVLLGYAEVADLDFEAAKQAFENALEILPDLPRAEEGLGRALVRLGEREKARELLAKQAANRISNRQDRTEEELFADELRDYSNKYLDIAKVLEAAGEQPSAMLVLRKALIMDGQKMDAWSALIGAFRGSGQIREAMDIARQMCEKNPQNAGAHYTLGIIASQAGEQSLAKSELEKVIDLAPENYTGYEALARLLIQMRGNPEVILQLATRAVSLRNVASNHELLGQAYAINGRFEQAREELAKAIEMDPQNQVYQQAMRQLEQFISQAGSGN